MSKINNSTNLYGTAKWIVDPVLGSGTHTTIAGAVAAATSGDTIFIRPGSYTENITYTKSLIFYAYAPENRFGISNVTIVGKHTVNADSLNLQFNGINLNTNADYIVTCAHASCGITFQNCHFGITNNDAISLTDSSSTTNLYCYNCTAGISGAYNLFSTTSAAVWLINCQMIDTAPGTASTTSQGNVVLINSQFSFNFTTSGVGLITAQNCQWGPSQMPFVNEEWLTLEGTGISIVKGCIFYSGSSDCITVGAGHILNLENCTFSSSATDVLTGAGTLNYSNLTFDGSSSGTNVITENALATLPAFPALPLSIANGGTNATSMTHTDGVVYYDGTRLVTTAVGSATEILTSNGAGFAPSFQAAPAGGIGTVQGDSGTVTGSTIDLYANHGSASCGSSISFTSASATEMDLVVTDVNNNTILGLSSGNGSLTGGYNNAFGPYSFEFLSIGNQNTSCGASCFSQMTTGSYNSGLGNGAGSNYTSSESSNLLLNNAGVIGESNVIRIGTQGSSSGEQDTCYIAGIVGNAVANTEFVTIDSVTGQLGVTAGGGISSVVRQVFTSSGTYTPTAGMAYCDIQVVGGGGGGGGCATSAAGNVAAGGGGGGGYAQGIFSAASIGASKAVTIGAAGTAGASGGANAGGTGGTSSVSTLISATGGTGGGGATNTATTGSSNQPGQGGSGSNGDYQTTGAPGTFGFWLGPTPAVVFPGTGGSSYFGGGAYAANSGAVGGGLSGVAGTSYGGGGSGGWDSYDGRVISGGAGAAGIVIVTEYVG